VTTPHRPTWTNLRTDRERYADGALDDLLSHIQLGNRSQCYVRDSLSEAFGRGEEQGETRALRLLLLARVRWSGDPLVEAAIREIVTLLAPDVGALLRPEGE
jgi:hypothetical protein